MSERDALLKKSRRSLGAARHLERGGFHEESVSRAYYAMFYSAEAVLLTRGVTVSTHSGVHTMFGKHFIKTGVFPNTMSTHLGQVFKARQSADYAAAEKAPADAREALAKAAAFIETVEQHLREKSDTADS